MSGSTSTQPGVSAQSVHLLLAASRTSLAPACFPSITIYQATIKAEGRALASLCVRKTKEKNNNSAEKKLTQKTPELVVKADLLLKCQIANRLWSTVSALYGHANSSKVACAARASGVLVLISVIMIVSKDAVHRFYSHTDTFIVWKKPCLDARFSFDCQ